MLFWSELPGLTTHLYHVIDGLRLGFHSVKSDMAEVTVPYIRVGQELFYNLYVHVKMIYRRHVGHRILRYTICVIF